MAEAEPVTGGCLCGKIRYDAQAYIRDAYYCHCRTCQKTTGAPGEIGVLLVPGTLRYEDAEPTSTSPRTLENAASATDAGHASSGHRRTTKSRNGTMSRPAVSMKPNVSCRPRINAWNRGSRGTASTTGCPTTAATRCRN